MVQVRARVESPVTLLREHVTDPRALHAGAEVTTNGRCAHLQQVALDGPPERRPGPRGLRTARVVVAGRGLVRDQRRAMSRRRRASRASGDDTLVLVAIDAQ